MKLARADHAAPEFASRSVPTRPVSSQPVSSRPSAPEPTEPGSTRAARWSVLGGAACLSGSAVLVKLSGVEATTSAFLRCALALVALVPMAAVELRRRGRVGATSLAWAAAAGVCLGVDYLLWTRSIGDVGAAVATVLVSVQVIVLPVLARLCDGTRIPRRFLLVSPVMVAATGMVGGVFGGALGGGGAAGGGAHPVRGALLGVGAGVAYAGYLYLNRRCGERDPEHASTPVCVATAVAALVCGAVGLAGVGGAHLTLSLPAVAWAEMAALALLGQVAAYVLIGRGSRGVAPSTAGTLLLLQPALAVVLGLLVPREHPGAVALAGCAVMVAAVRLAQPR